MDDPFVGLSIGQYRVLELIGRGGMATVYRAHQAALDRHVAVKVLPPYLASDPDFSERFRREARAIARLEHPNILSVHDFGEHEGVSFIVMPLVTGGSLKQRMGSPWPVQAALNMCSQVAHALDYAHSHGVIHRDVKPANVLLAAGEWALLADFGLAKLIGSSAGITRSGVSMGTPAYMSPEQGQGLEVDARADVYSLGVLLFEMLAGTAPYRADTPLAVIWKQINDPVPSLCARNPAVPPEADAIIEKALAKHPGDRFDSAGEFIEALQAAVRKPAFDRTPAAPTLPVVEAQRDSLQSLATLDVGDDQSALHPADAEPTPSIGTLDAPAVVASVPRRSSRRIRLLAGTVAAVMVAAGLLAVASQRSPEPVPVRPAIAGESPAGACADRAPALSSAESALSEGSLSLAQGLFESVRRGCPGADVDARLLGLGLLLAAEDARNGGDWDGALALMRELAATEPDFPRLKPALHSALLGAGRAALAGGFLGDAERLCSEALSIEPDDEPAAQCVGQAQPSPPVVATPAVVSQPPPVVRVPPTPVPARPLPTVEPPARVVVEPTAVKPPFAPPAGGER